MSSNVVNQSPFLRTSRNFPLEAQPLSVEMNRSYVDIAEKLNSRTIGLYSIIMPSQTGEGWYLSNNQKQQGFRQAYTFTTTANIAHNIPVSTLSYISPKTYGSFTDGTNWYGLIYGSNVSIAGQISFYITPTNIVFLTGGGSPALTKGVIVVEWISQA